MSNRIIDGMISEETQDKIINEGKHGLIFSNGYALVLLLSCKSSLCLITEDSIDIRITKYLHKKALKKIAIGLVENCGGEIIGEL